MKKDVFTEELLKAKMEVLRKNLDGVGEEILRTKYPAAYEKLLREIFSLANLFLEESVMYLDLSVVKPEAKPLFAKIINSGAGKLAAAIKKGDYETFLNGVEEIRIIYTTAWCDNAIVCSHLKAYEFNPFTCKYA